MQVSLPILRHPVGRSRHGLIERVMLRRRQRRAVVELVGAELQNQDSPGS